MDSKQESPNNSISTRKHERSQFICRVKYQNRLPDIPFDLKFIQCPFARSKFVQYRATALEKNSIHELYGSPAELGVVIDMLDPNSYNYCPPGVELHPDDEKLLEDEACNPKPEKSRHQGKSVPWLRRPEYISNEATRFQPQTIENVETRVGFRLRQFDVDVLYKDRHSQIEAIEKTFEDNKLPIISHYSSRQNVVPLYVKDVFPDFCLWKFACADVIFDYDPPSATIEELSHAMLRGVKHDNGEHIVVHFLPSKRANVDDECTNSNEYIMSMEYDWIVKDKTKHYQENYFLVDRLDGNIYYNELDTRVQLRKRRKKSEMEDNGKTKLLIRYRDLNDDELSNQKYRQKQLEDAEERDFL